MEKLKNTPFESLHLPDGSALEKVDNTFYLTKFNWDYKECEAFQVQVNEIIAKNREYKFYIFTNHPHVFTLGRGNERGEENLIDFDLTMQNSLVFPVHKIHRGGGVTFHYPGQWIFYPIVSISNKYTLDDHMCWILKSVKNGLKEYYAIDNLLTAKKLMGIWMDKKKLASIGVGLHRYVTLHGLALNLVYDQKMFAEVVKINPCGLDSTVYQCVDQITKNPVNVNEFNSFFIKSIR